jgi:hypothetical protein
MSTSDDRTSKPPRSVGVYQRPDHTRRKRITWAVVIVMVLLSLLLSLWLWGVFG